jgi:hypothetical protein
LFDFSKSAAEADLWKTVVGSQVPAQEQSSQAGGMAQMVEYLPSKCEALSSNFSTEKRKKKQSSFAEQSTGGSCRTQITNRNQLIISECVFFLVAKNNSFITPSPKQTWSFLFLFPLLKQRIRKCQNGY